MSTPSLAAQIEAILYLKGRPIGLNELGYPYWNETDNPAYTLFL